MLNRLRPLGGIAVFLALAFLSAKTWAATESVAPKAPPSIANKSTADHSKFKELQGPFASGPEVTKACLVCHTEAAKQVHQTLHWTWEFANPDTGQKLGKKNIINNFCVSTATNEPRCTSCHIGYGWKDKSFDFTSETAVDCLVCHDRTGSYAKFPTDAGHPAYQDKEFPKGKLWKATDLPKVAQSIGKTSRQTCGACHFLGGGGDAVKHGDIDTTLGMPNKDLDVHMDAKGLNFACATCHTSNSHAIEGSRFVTKAVDKVGIDVPGKTDNSRATCESCHGYTPHKESKFAPKLNEHTDVVACPTCHVPEFARGKPTKMLWDWSTAGKMGPDGKPFLKKDDKGDIIYDSMKGDFAWAKDVKPVYKWFNGEVRYTMMSDKIDPTKIVPINMLGGKSNDKNSRIWPFKEMMGRQPYDKVNLNLLKPHVFGKDDSAFWGNFKWDKALDFAMKGEGVPYSGQFAFVDSVYYWPITHMVAPKDKALRCSTCHAREGRMAGIEGIYIPGRDRFAWLDLIGFGVAGLTLLGALGHGLLRLIASTRKSQ
jgi:octaheme c-type cytochrome (tetrathionate reductase family)